jgi:hypothetical protein
MATTEELVLAKVAEAAPYRAMRLVESPPAIPADAYVTAAKGDIASGLIEVPGVAARKVWGVGVLDVDIGTLWAAIDDETRQADYNAIDFSQIQTGAPCEAGHTTFQFLSVAMATDRWWVTKPVENTALKEKSGGTVREYAWTSSVDLADVKTADALAKTKDGMPIAWTKGGWFLIALDESRTIAEYNVWTDPGGSIPAGMASWFASGSIDGVMEAVVAFAKQGSPRCAKQ